MPVLPGGSQTLVTVERLRVRAWGFTHAGVDLTAGNVRAIVPTCYPFLNVNTSTILMLDDVSEQVENNKRIDCLTCIAMGWL